MGNMGGFPSRTRNGRNWGAKAVGTQERVMSTYNRDLATNIRGSVRIELAFLGFNRIMWPRAVRRRRLGLPMAFILD